jgi:hypothetical protein
VTEAATTAGAQAARDRLIPITAGLVLILAAATCVHFALQPDVRHLMVMVADDASYYLTTARNIAAGHGMTFDGLHPTNGFHPLWLSLLVPLFLVPAAPETLVREVVLLQGALLAGAYLLLYRVHASLFGARTALLSGIAFVFVGAVPSINGMETALAVLLLIGLYAYAWHLWCAPPSAARTIIGGALAGLLVLSRLDMVVVVAAAVLCALPWLADASRGRLLRAPMLQAAIGFCAVVAPYLLYNELATGAVMPISGALKSSFPKLSLSAGTLGAIGLRYYACAALALGWLLWRRLRTGRLLPQPDEHFHTLTITVLACAVLLHLVHTVLFLRWGVSPWHFVLYRIFFVMLLAALFDWLLRQRALLATPARYWAAVALLLAAGIARTYATDRYPLNGSWHAAVYQAAVWARSHTAPETVFAMSDSGDFAFFSERRVVNLDGLANNMDYQRVLRTQSLNRYLRDSGVQYLVQHAVHGHPDVVQGDYDSYALRFESHRYNAMSDDVVVLRRNEAYRSLPYFDGNDRVVLIIWRL